MEAEYEGYQISHDCMVHLRATDGVTILGQLVSGWVGGWRVLGQGGGVVEGYQMGPCCVVCLRAANGVTIWESRCLEVGKLVCRA